MPLKNDGHPAPWQIVARLLPLASALLICLAAAELFLRFAGIQPQVTEPAIFAFDDTLGWLGKPNFVANLVRGQGTIRYEMNCWGFRDDPPAPREAASKRRRVMLLGDSYVMGYEIPQELRVSELMEKADTSLLVYNFGILGYSSDQELLVLKKYGPEIQPEIILLFFCVNDLYYSEQDEVNGHAKPLFQRQPDETLGLVNVPLEPPGWLERSAGWLTAHLAVGKTTSQAVARLAETLRPARRRARGGRWFVGREGGRDEQLLIASPEEASDLTYYILREMWDESARLGAKFCVFMCPSSRRWTQTRNDSPAAIALALSWCEKSKISAVDLFPLLRKDYLDNGQDLYIYDKMHWNERANRLIADSVIKIVQTPLVEPADTSN